MRDSRNAFHLAVPCGDLDESWAFYIDGLGCRSGKRYDDRITLDFFGDQLVCHYYPDAVDPEPKTYPRHFGVVLHAASDYEAIHRRAAEAGLKFHQRDFVRFAGEVREHRAFFLVDPSNNLIEFKHYEHPDGLY